MAIGALRARLTIEQPVRTADGGGGATIAWSALATVWGAIMPAGGAEAISAEQRVSRVSHRIRLRYRSDVTPAMRLSAPGRVFRIKTMFDPDGRGRWLDCLCEEEFGA